MVIAPNDLFSWNNRYNEYNVTVNIYTFFLKLYTWTYSVQARILKPWQGNLPRLPAISSFCHVFPPPLSGFNWCSLSPLEGPGPSTSKMAPLSTGSAHTPLPGFGTVKYQRINAQTFADIKWFIFNEKKWQFFYLMNMRLFFSLLNVNSIDDIEKKRAPT